MKGDLRDRIEGIVAGLEHEQRNCDDKAAGLSPVDAARFDGKASTIRDLIGTLKSALKLSL